MKCSAGVYALFFFFFFVRCRLSVETLLRVCIYIQYESNVTYSLIHFIIDANDVLKYKWHQRNHSLNIWCDRYVMKSIIKSFWLYWIWSRPDRNDCLIIFKERFLILETNQTDSMWIVSASVCVHFTGFGLIHEHILNFNLLMVVRRYMYIHARSECWFKIS